MKKSVRPIIFFLFQLFYVLNGSSDVVSNYFYIYDCDQDVVVPVNKSTRLLPSSCTMVKDALKGRTTAAAKTVLRDQGLEVSSSQVGSY